ncbi:cytochrome P450 4c21 [Culex quinquefasciatus]|uniref:cytochrome P450 4c21 n=1 Tax=Culex quinquefasciatus TaxID=7176 RepID=UPI0018E2C72C|nr:cytochrome P450 4c21 [Culex quinquefasciatus]
MIAVAVLVPFLWAVLVAGLLFLLCRFWREKVKFAESLPRAEPCYPIVGNLPVAFGKSSDEIFLVLHEWFRQQDRMFTLRCGTLVAVGVTHPELIQRVLTHPDCQEKPDVYKVVRLPSGLLAARYQTWKVHRKTLNSTFNTRILDSFMPIFNSCAGRLIDRLGQHVDRKDATVACNMLEYISECTLEMISRTSLGGKALEREGKQDFIENLEVALTTLGKRIFNILLHNELIYRFTALYRNEMKAIDTCHRFTDKIIAEKRQELGCHLQQPLETDENGNPKESTLETIICEDEHYKRPQIFIDQLMKVPLVNGGGGHNFTDQEISDHIYTMIVAGNETSATQLSHTCLLLAMHPEVQAKAYHEVQEVLTADHTPIDLHDLKQLVYVEAVLKETMRLMPVAPIIARENLQDIQLDGHTIPKGTPLLMNFYTLHRREDIWGAHSDRFNPEHFLQEDAKSRHPYAHLPFSGGPRGCIGYRYAMMSLKMLLAMILKHFELATDIRYEDIKYHYQISLNLAFPHAIRLKRRT